MRAPRSGPHAQAVAANLVHPEEARALVAKAGEQGRHPRPCRRARLLQAAPRREARAVGPDARRERPRLPPPRASRFGPNAGRRPARRPLEPRQLASRAGVRRHRRRRRPRSRPSSRSLAVELGPRGILVNTVSAGLVPTASVRLHPRYEELAARARAASPLGPPRDSRRRWLRPSSSSSRRSPHGSRGRRSSSTAGRASRPEPPGARHGRHDPASGGRNHDGPRHVARLPRSSTPSPAGACSSSATSWRTSSSTDASPGSLARRPC